MINAIATFTMIECSFKIKTREKKKKKKKKPSCPHHSISQKRIWSKITRNHIHIGNTIH